MKPKNGAAASERRLLSRRILLLCFASFFLGMLISDRFGSVPCAFVVPRLLQERELQSLPQEFVARPVGLPNP